MQPENGVKYNSLPNKKKTLCFHVYINTDKGIFLFIVNGVQMENALRLMVRASEKACKIKTILAFLGTKTGALNL